MTQFSNDCKGQTVIATFQKTPGTVSDLLHETKADCADFIRHQSGFISARLHVNDAQTRIANRSLGTRATPRSPHDAAGSNRSLSVWHLLTETRETQCRSSDFCRF